MTRLLVAGAVAYWLGRVLKDTRHRHETQPRLVRVGGYPLDIETGWWCDRCLTPSAVWVYYALADEDTLMMIDRGALVHCTQCDAEHPVPLDG